MKKNESSASRFVELKKKYFENGISSLTFEEVLELLLMFSDSRVDASGLAKKLSSTFGSLRTVFEAPRVSLKDMGLKDKEAVLLMMMPGLCKKYRICKTELKFHNKPLNTGDEIAEYILPHFTGKRVEVVILLLMDKHKRVRYCGITDEGTINASDVSIMKTLELCVRYKACYAVLAHNHPSGIALPSGKDIEITSRLIKTMKLIGVDLIDHIIFSESEWTFLSELDTTKELFAGEQTLNDKKKPKKTV